MVKEVRSGDQNELWYLGCRRQLLRKKVTGTVDRQSRALPRLGINGVAVS